MVISIVLAILLLQNFQEIGVSGTTFTFVNKCSQTIWPAILGTPALDTTGFELSKGSSRVIQAPTGWSGRFWGRTGCNFDGSGHGSCATGDCGSDHMECNGAGSKAATLVEFTLGSGSMDFYDVSLVDGYNLPVMVEVKGGSGQCESTGCVVDLNSRCPNELKADGGGACKSACDVFGTSEYCCKGEYGSPATCHPSTYSQMFKNACPKSYSYAYDDATSTFTCKGADYVMTFCPSQSNSQKSSKSDDVQDDSGSSNEGESEQTGSMESAVLADGSWLAKLATGDSTRMHHIGFPGQVLVLLVHLAIVLVHLKL